MTASNERLPDEIQNITYLHQVFAKQKSAYTSNAYPSAKQRCENLDALATAVRKYKHEFADAIYQDFSCRSKDESLLLEIMVVLESIKYNKKNIKKWMKPSKRHVSALFAPASNKVIYQPKGVVGIIVPWNYPVQLALVPVVAALAAGNRAMCKLSEFTPATNLVMQRMLAETFNEDLVAAVAGEAEVGVEFSKQHWDHLIFTGSTMVGRHVMEAAGKKLVPVTLELGGKSPCIITDTASLKGAAESIIFGKATNSGQTCIAPDYILCPENMVYDLKSEIAAAYKKCFPTLKYNDDYTAIINERQFNRLQGYLTDAQQKGATLETLNNAHEDFTGTRKIPLTLLTHTTDKMEVMKNEIFGPLLPILSYQSLDEALDYINERPRPLALYLFSFDRKVQDHVMTQTHAGGACINDTFLHAAQDDMPFGGLGDSGIGHYHGKEGFLSLSHAKAIHQKGRFNSGKFIHAPHGRLVHRLIYKFIIR